LETHISIFCYHPVVRQGLDEEERDERAEQCKATANPEGAGVALVAGRSTKGC